MDFTVGSCMINCLLSADDLVLLASVEQRLQRSPYRFSIACDHAGVKISSKNSEVVSYQKSKPVSTASKRQYTAAWCRSLSSLRWYSQSDGRRNKKNDTWIGKAHAVLREHQFSNQSLLRSSLMVMNLGYNR